MKDIKGYEKQYAITEDGRVWSYKSNKFLKLQYNQGYLYVYLSKNGLLKSHRVHRLVADAFIPNPDNLPEINHRDENALNNHVSNLEWCTREYNNNYGEHQLRSAISRGKPVRCIETGKVYWSAAEAERSENLYRDGVGAVCRGNRKTCGGYHWEYIEEAE